MTSIPPHLSKNFLPDGAGPDVVRRSMLKHLYKDAPTVSSAVLEQDLQAHLARVKINRERIIPWLDSVRTLSGARVLEIGCGTGASTLALAEQGARVTALDVDLDSIRVAYDRCAAYGVNAEFLVANGAELEKLFLAGTFDWILIYATLEHMTFPERLGCLKQSWEMLPSGSFLAVIDTPNRLWFHDDHTSLLPFFHWLPNDVAFHYSRFSSRANFQELYREYTPENRAHFLSRGRGVSFHEFELAIKPRAELQVVSCMSMFHRERNPAENHEWTQSTSAVFEALLHHACPDLHQGFLQPYLDLVLRRS